MADVCAQGRHDSQARTDRRIVNEGGIVVAESLVHVGMIRVARIGHGLEQLGEAGYAYAIIRWCILFSADVTSIGGIGCDSSEVGQGKLKLPVVPIIVDYTEERKSD